jgi:uncharacterized protein (DUF885 family)
MILAAAVLASSTSAAALDALVAREWERQMARNPVWSSLLGETAHAAQWDDLHPEALAREVERDRVVLREIEALPGDGLTPEQQLTRELLRRGYADAIAAHDAGAHFLKLSHMDGLPEGLDAAPGVHALDELGPNLAFADAAAWDAWMTRLRTLPRYVEGATALLRAGMKAGRLHPRLVVDRLVKILDAQLAVDAAQSGFEEPFRRGAGSPRRAEADALVRTTVYPALRGFRDFLATEYLAAAPETGGLSRQGGGALYAHLVAHHTTTRLTPREVHDLGLREVARIRREMEEVKAAAQFEGTLPGFFAHLRTDPRFFHRSPEELLVAYRALAKSIDPKLVKLFGVLPRMPYGVEPTPAAQAPHVTTGFYYPAAPDGSRPGTYLVNLYRPETRPKWEMVPLTLHEAVPGHHLQVSRAAELPDLPAFRRLGSYTAFGEGWGLYAEWLGKEMGLYADPHDLFGQLAYDMWRAVRLVVDTGMHELGWTREQAIRYFLDNSPRAELDVTNEVDRYLSMPGQALAYKVGQMKILELRRRAESKLGPRFDVRGFHDEVLGAGSLPLDVLEARMDAWIARRAALPR